MGLVQKKRLVKSAVYHVAGSFGAAGVAGPSSVSQYWRAAMSGTTSPLHRDTVLYHVVSLHSDPFP